MRSYGENSLHTAEWKEGRWRRWINEWAVVLIVPLEQPHSWINYKQWRGWRVSAMCLMDDTIRERPITELIGNISDPEFLIPPSRRRFPQLVALRRSLMKHFSLLFFVFFLMTQHDFLSDTEKRQEEEIFPSCRWRYHKMIITTTIWWVHNWLNIKNVPRDLSGVDGGWGREAETS